MTRPLTYGDFRRQGWQDCDNVIDFDMFDFDAGTPAQIVESLEWTSAADWISQQDDFEGLDPRKAYAAWREGWTECAIGHITRKLKREPRGNPAAKAATKATKSGAAQRIVMTIKRDAGFPKLTVTNPAQAVVALTHLIGDRSTEFFATLYLDARNVVIGYDLFTSGSIAGVEVHPQGIFANAIGVGASAIVSAHNHPSGAPTPSPDDLRLWKRLEEAGELMGIPMLDNLVITDSGSKFYSQKENAP